MIALASLVLLAGVRQDPQALVGELLERTNGLKSFVAEYRVRGRKTEPPHDEYEGDLRLVFRAPEDLLVEFRTEGYRARSLITGGRISVRIEKKGEPVQQGEAVVPPAAVQARERILKTFHEKFPSLSGVVGPAGLDLFVRFRWKPGTSTERPEFHVEAGTGRGDGPLLDWLGRLQRPDARVAVEERSIVWHPSEDLRVLVAKDSGFIQQVVSTYAGETKTNLELSKLALDADVAGEELRPPPADPSAQDVSSTLGAGLGAGMLLALSGSIHRSIRDGKVDPAGDGRAALSEVFSALHREIAPALSGSGLTASRARIDDFAKRSRESKLTPDELAARRAELEERLRKSSEGGLAPYLVRAVPEIDGLDPAIRALELQCAESAYRETVVEPLIRYLREQLER